MRRSTRSKGDSTEKSVSPAPAAPRKRKKAPDNEDSNDGGNSDATDTTDVSCSSSLSNLSEVSFEKIAFVKLRRLMIKSQATSQIKVTLAKRLTEKKIIEQFNKKKLVKPISIR